MSALILVIDNDPATVRLVQQRVATATEIRVISAPGALQGLEMAVERAPGLVLLNADLADGLLVCDHLRQQATFAGVPIVLVTDPTRGRLDPASIGGRADLTLTKPLPEDALDPMLVRAFGPDWRSRTARPSVAAGPSGASRRIRQRPVRSFVTAGPSRTDLGAVVRGELTSDDAAPLGDEPTSVDARPLLRQATTVDPVALDEPTISDGIGPRASAQLMVEWSRALTDDTATGEGAGRVPALEADIARLTTTLERYKSAMGEAARNAARAEETRDRVQEDLAKARRESDELGAALAAARDELNTSGGATASDAADVAALQAAVAQLRDEGAMLARERQAAEVAIIDVMDRYELSKARSADLLFGISQERDVARVQAAELRRQVAALEAAPKPAPIHTPAPGRSERITELEQQLRERDYALAAAHAERDQALETLEERAGRQLEQANARIATVEQELDGLRALAPPGAADPGAEIAPPDAAQLGSLLEHLDVHREQLEDDLENWDATQMKLAELLEGLRRAAKRYPGLQRGIYAVDTIVDGVADALAQGRDALRRSIKTLSEQHDAVSTALGSDSDADPPSE